jgi:hypothetical protein
MPRHGSAQSVNLSKNVQKKTSDEPSTINGRAQNAALE